MARRLVNIVFILILSYQPVFSYIGYSEGIQRNISAKTITITVPGKKLSILIDYSSGCSIKQLNIKGHNVLSTSGIKTGIQTKNGSYFSDKQAGAIKITGNQDHIILSGIHYGDGHVTVDETWNFKLNGDKVAWTISRDYNNTTELEDSAFPKWSFSDLNTWKGGILDNGGMVWCKYLKNVNDTYGVHTGGVTFWNANTGDGLKITAKPGTGSTIAAKYSQSDKNEFTCQQIVSNEPLNQRYDLSRFVSQKADVFAPFKINKGRITVQYELSYEDYFAKYSRGNLTGIDAVSVRELLNTTGRYGVVDNNIVGGNGWLTNWKCMHEPFFAQIGLAVDDENYTRNFSATLNQERDEAMLADGRMLSRWHNAAGDEISGTYNAKTGYYEAMWGYTVDSQTGYVINASEQFDINGDVTWLKSHQASCERALEWLISRDRNHNGIFEMVNNNTAEKKASDWLDIVWASYENAFVNAQMYEALKLWANCEKVLGNHQKAAFYTATADKLKITFNKPVSEGGFWLPAKKQYVYWRDNDGTTHGDNLVTPVNFAAIAFGICDDPIRIAQILDQIEQRTMSEHLFHWPLCFDSFTREEVSAGNWPFPKYENGDIFPTWGYLGIRAYAGYDKKIALKYIRNLLEQYKKDGLSSQRYSRISQLGLGEDILAGICTTVTGLYRDIYGICPKWNRMGLEPNMSDALNGTRFSYTLRDTVYDISLSTNNYTMHTNGFSINSNEKFGASKAWNKLTYYHHNQDSTWLQISGKSEHPVALAVNSWTPQKISYAVSSPDTYEFIIKGLQPGSDYELIINGKVKHLPANKNGSLNFRQACKSVVNFIIKKAA
jgi:tetratricopeptide (TPR) repeat protein